MYKKNRDEDRDKSCDHLKSSSSEESVRKRRPSGNISINSQLSIFSQTTTSTELDTQQQLTRKNTHLQIQLKFKLFICKIISLQIQIHHLKRLDRINRTA